MAVLAGYCHWMMGWQQAGRLVSMVVEHERIKAGQEDPKEYITELLKHRYTWEGLKLPL